MLKKNTTGSPIYRISIDVETLKGLTLDSDLVGGSVSLTLGDVTLKSISGNMQGRMDDIVEVACASQSATVSIAKKTISRNNPSGRSTSTASSTDEPEV